MKPHIFRNVQAVVLFGTLLTASAQTVPVLPQIPPSGQPRLQGVLNIPPNGGPAGLPCGQNRLTALEQLQNGATYSDILQQEQRAVACKVNSAVVEVIASGFGATPGQEYDSPASATPGPSIGSGVIVSADGYIVTNRHVIKGAPRITVVLHMNGRPDDPVPAVLKGQDANTDLALLQVARTGLPFLEFSRQPVQQGDTVYAFGSPHGVGISMTKGIISAPVRQVKEEDQVDYIQTDAAINPGNSGGALVDINGRLAGINTFILSGSGGNEGLNFAIPADVVGYIFGQLKNNGYVIRGTIGISTRNLSPELIRALKLPVQVGVYVEDVEPKGPADDAGIEVGDIVVAYDNFPLDGRRTQDSALDLKRAISGRAKGQTIRLDVLQHGIKKTINVVVNQASTNSSEETPQLTSDYIIDALGIYGLKMGMSAAAIQHLRVPQGVLVAAKIQSMSATVSDLLVEDVIHEINGQPVTELDDLRKVLDTAEPGSTVALQVERERKMMIILVTIN